MGVGFLSYFRVAREGLSDKVTFGQGSEGSEGEFGDTKTHREIISCKGS